MATTRCPDSRGCALSSTGGHAALAALRRALTVADDPLHRAALLPAVVEVLLAADESAGAAGAAQELTELALRWPSPGLRAAALLASGAVALADGAAAAAAAALRDAWRSWTAQQAPYQAAHARLLLGRACTTLGDEDTAAAHEKAAEAAIAALRGAVLPLTAGPDHWSAVPLGLSPREAQVLRLVATGRTNRAIAECLVLSERTIDRHVSNVLGKLGVATRTEAAAFAFQRGLA